MTTARRPTLDSDSLDDAPPAPDTLDVITPVRGYPIDDIDESDAPIPTVQTSAERRRTAVGSDRDMPPIHVTPSDVRDSEWGRDLTVRLAATELAAAKATTWNKRIVYALSLLTGVAGTALALAFHITSTSGEAAGEKRERDAQRVRNLATLAQLVVDVARHEGQISSLIERSRYPIGAVPIAGPPNNPSPPGAP